MRCASSAVGLAFGQAGEVDPGHRNAWVDLSGISHVASHQQDQAKKEEEGDPARQRQQGL